MNYFPSHPFCPGVPDRNEHPEIYDSYMKNEERASEKLRKEIEVEQNQKTLLKEECFTNFLLSIIKEQAYGSVNVGAYIVPIILVNIAMATLGKCKVISHLDIKYPLNFFFQITGPSGSGKTHNIEKFNSPIRLIDQDIRKKRNDEMDRYTRESEKIKISKDKLKRQYLKTNDPVLASQLLDEIEVLTKLQPKKPKPPASIFLTSTTPTAIIEHLQRTNGSLFLINHEAFEFFTQTTKGEPSKFNDLYDGKPYSKNTLSKGEVYIEQVHFNMVNAIQNERLPGLYAAHAEKWLASGYIARTLPMINVGNAFPLEGIHQEKPDEDHYYKDYCDRTYQIYERFDRLEKLEKLEMQLSVSAQEEFKGQLFRAIKYHEQYPQLSSFISRQSEHILKLAAVLSLLDDPMATELSASAVVAAGHLFEYHLKMHDILINHEEIYNFNGIAKDAPTILLKMKEGAIHGVVPLEWFQPRVMKSRRSISALQVVLDYLIRTNMIRESGSGHKKAYYVERHW